MQPGIVAAVFNRMALFVIRHADHNDSYRPNREPPFPGIFGGAGFTHLGFHRKNIYVAFSPCSRINSIRRVEGNVFPPQSHRYVG